MLRPLALLLRYSFCFLEFGVKSGNCFQFAARHAYTFLKYLQEVLGIAFTYQRYNIGFNFCQDPPGQKINVEKTKAMFVRIAVIIAMARNKSKPHTFNTRENSFNTGELGEI